MLGIIQQVLFIAAFATAIYIFRKKALEIYGNIKLGKDEDRTDNPAERFKNMLLLALGQKKMFRNLIPAILHLFVYVGFILINIEVLEIVLDGILGTHRLFLPLLGNFYYIVIGFFEILAVAVLVSCVIFWIRRNLMSIDRFQKPEMKGWAFKDANYILYAEIILMAAVLLMNASDLALQEINDPHYKKTGTFLISGFIAPLFSGLSANTLIGIERVAWWAHILGIFAFLNYLPYSKHLHIILAFPNSYYGDLQSKGEMDNMPRITQEIKLMMDPNAPMPEEEAEPEKFGAKDVNDLSWKNILDGYSCTECGRCTAACPANQTGKLLSPRKIMMDTRDRAEEKGKAIREHGADFDDGKSLLHDYISVEELRACTTCNACVEECPVSINPLDIILELRRYLILEESNSPEEWNLMFGNVETNGAVWKMPASDRANWVNEIND